MEEAETLKLGFIFVCLEILQSGFYGLEKKEDTRVSAKSTQCIIAIGLVFASV